MDKATINGKPIDLRGTYGDAIVEGGEATQLVGITGGATIGSAPEMALITEGNGAYTFGGNEYQINDTADGSVKFVTDANSGLSSIEDFAGSISGAVSELKLNGKDFGTNDSQVTVSTDGEVISAIYGLKSGDSIGGDLDDANFLMPEGTLTINGAEVTLEDDADGVSVSNGGKVFTGMAKDASLNVGEEGTYKVNGRASKANAGDSFTVNRDGAYKINPEHLPIIEKTPASDITARGGSGLKLMESSGTVGAGSDSVVVRNNASVSVDVGDDKETLIVPTSGTVTLENYDGGNAAIGTSEYSYLVNAIKSNEIKFGDGVMTLGDAVITFDADAKSIGSTFTHLVNAVGSEQAVAFTHTAGGTINESKSTEAIVAKGNYAEKAEDTQKSGGSTITTGKGNDTLLIGGGDVANAGGGTNQIYITDAALRDEGAVVVLGTSGTNTVHNFNGGYGADSDEILINDISAIEFDGGSSGLVMSSGKAIMTFNDLARSDELVNLSGDAVFIDDASYRLKLKDASKTYNAAVAWGEKNISVGDGDLANAFFGKDSGINFSEYTGAVAVNLNDGTGNLSGNAALFKGINKLKGGAGATTLIGAAGEQNTLMAGSGNGDIWSAAGNDLMVGSADKTAGSTTFRYLANDGFDTISNFDFMTSSADTTADMIDITEANAVTSVTISGSDVVLGINNSDSDYLTLAQAVGKDFKINNLIAKVAEKNIDYDGFANCYVADGTNATMAIGAGIDDAQVWLNDNQTGLHGVYYLGDIRVLDATAATGSNILAGNELDNIIMGGSGLNSIWGGYGYNNDVMIGGTGQNTFFFAFVNGNDTVQNAHNGDVIDLSTVELKYITGTAISAEGTAIALIDGSVLEVQSNAAIDYKTADGTYVADHTTGQWIKKG